MFGLKFRIRYNYTQFYPVLKFLPRGVYFSLDGWKVTPPLRGSTAPIHTKIICDHTIAIINKFQFQNVWLKISYYVQLHAVLSYTTVLKNFEKNSNNRRTC